MYNRGTKQLNKNNYAKALQFFKKETGYFKELYLNMGNSYRGLGEYAKAMYCYREANKEACPSVETRRGGEYPLALSNMGLLYYAAGDDSKAIECYNRALVLDPLYPEAIWNYSNALLRSTNCEKGWDMYEYRFKRNSGAVRIEKYGIAWDGVTAGDSIVVLAEQGLGDKIMFSRYLPKLKEFFDTVYVQCHPSLDCFYKDYNICRDACTSKATYSIGICSLAKIFGVIEVGGWAPSFTANKFGAGLNIGCVWSGSLTHANNKNRSCVSSYFSSLSNYGNLYSLSPDAPAAKNITALSSKSWEETASNILGLDCVVSVDTSIVHLCGTLGVPCIMVQPLRETDFRWGYGGKNVWYDSVVTVPNNNSWDSTFKHVHSLLDIIKKDKQYKDWVGCGKDELEAMNEEQLKEHFKCIEK